MLMNTLCAGEILFMSFSTQVPNTLPCLYNFINRLYHVPFFKDTFKKSHKVFKNVFHNVEGNTSQKMKANMQSEFNSKNG